MSKKDQDNYRKRKNTLHKKAARLAKENGISVTLLVAVRLFTRPISNLRIKRSRKAWR